jgi:hypothetical protein
MDVNDSLKKKISEHHEKEKKRENEHHSTPRNIFSSLPIPSTICVTPSPESMTTPVVRPIYPDVEIKRG